MIRRTEMGELINVTDAFTYNKNKNIYTLRNPSDGPIPESGPTMINIKLPDSYINGDIPDDDVYQDRIEITKVPFSKSELDLSTVDLLVNVVTADGAELLQVPYGDDVIKSEGPVPISGDIIIPDQEQISLPDQIRKNMDKLMLNKLGLKDGDYLEWNYYNLFAKDESCKDLTIGVSVRTRRTYLQLMEYINNPDIESDLSEDRIEVLNRKELEETIWSENKRTFGAYALLKARYLKEVVGRYI